MASPTEEVVGRMVREMASWKSIEMEVQESGTGPYGSAEITGRYIETVDGKRFYDEFLRGSTSGLKRRMAYCDGDKCAYVLYRPRGGKFGTLEQKEAIISNIFMDEKNNGQTSRPLPFCYFYVGRVPLYEALPKAQYLGSGQCIGRECDVFRFSRVKWAMATQDLVYYLDKATSIPLKVEHYIDQKSFEKKTPQVEWHAESLDEVQGYHMPFKSVQSWLDRVGRYNVKLLVYNKEYPKERFWPVLRPGLNVIEGVEPGVVKTYEVPGGPPKTIPTVANPIRAEEPSSWLEVAWPVTLALGVAVLAVGLFLRRRRQRAEA